MKTSKSRKISGKAKAVAPMPEPTTQPSEERKTHMAILQSIDGRFYQVPEDEAEKFLVPADKVEETLRASGAAQPQAAAAPGPCGAPMSTGGQAPVIIYIVGGGGQGGMGPQPMGAGPQEQQMGAPMGQQVQAYAHHGGHGGHGGGHGGHGGHWGGWGGHWGGGWGGCYNNYSNYRNYSNYYGW